MMFIYVWFAFVSQTNVGLFFSRQLPSEEEAEEGPQVSTDAPPPYSSIAADNAGTAQEFSCSSF